MSLELVSKDPINNISTSVQVMTWRRMGDKSFLELVMTQFNDAFMYVSSGLNMLMMIGLIILVYVF